MPYPATIEEVCATDEVAQYCRRVLGASLPPRR